MSRIKCFISLCVVFLSGLMLIALLSNRINMFHSSKGVEIPNAVLYSMDGTNKMNLKETYKGQYWLLHLMSSWCGYCQREIGVFSEIRSKSSIPMVAVSYKENNFEKFLGMVHGKFDVSLRDDLGLYFIDLGATGVPRTYIIDKNGSVIKVWNDLTNAGNLDDVFQTIENLG